ncbi:MAG: hypothetical protein ABIP51_04665 [Bacteroidia bacterium]
MYCLSDKQIDYIINDISARGVEMESLQQNLLDHVCCIIEQNLEVNGDFESFYQKTIKTFYKDALWEIEEETLLLLTFKNYYAMKKTMIVSGTIAATSFIIGSFFKIMHWPGTNVLIFFAMLLSSLVFLPLFFLFKTKQTIERKNKVIIAIGSLNGILFCFSSLFKIMYWPGANMLWILTIAMLALVFIPLFFFSGIKNPETKTNTIATTIILIMITGFFFALTSLGPAKRSTLSKMYDYQQTEELIARMNASKNVSVLKDAKLILLSEDIQDDCNKIKINILAYEIGHIKLSDDFETENIRMEESYIYYYKPGSQGYDDLIALKDKVLKYNSLIENKERNVPIQTTLEKMLDGHIMLYSNYNLLSSISKIQLFVLQNES